MGKLKHWFWFGIQVGIGFTVFMALLELLDSVGISQARGFVFQPISTLSALTGINLPGRNRGG